MRVMSTAADRARPRLDVLAFTSPLTHLDGRLSRRPAALTTISGDQSPAFIVRRAPERLRHRSLVKTLASAKLSRRVQAVSALADDMNIEADVRPALTLTLNVMSIVHDCADGTLARVELVKHTDKWEDMWQGYVTA